MEKQIWRQVKTLSSSSHKPSSRWGHSSCVVADEIVFFGGYADSTYMNDVWAFNSLTMKWREIQTSGDIPCQRSNCSMNYDPQNNQIVIFGGGGANKQRFNSISILDWNTKQWIEISPKQNEFAPWQRTYHAAQFLNPYLVVYGGQGVADMDDLWIFSFITLSWTEVKIPADKTRPCARRFHSSVTIGNEFIVLAGCHGKYRCLSDVFSMDLTSLMQTGNFDQLEWKQKKLKNSSFLTRWGHSSQVYDNKIYIFGGRFSNDLNDLLVADFQTNTIRSIKTNQQAPPARRRHCAGFIGSSMLVFGGFNGQYFQDLYHISLHQPKSKFQINTVFDQKQMMKCLNKKENADYCIKTSDNTDFYINIGLISKYFENQSDLGEFLDNINNQYSTEEIKNIFITIYNGFGELHLKQEHKAKFKHLIFQQKGDKISSERQKIEKSSADNSGRKIIKKAMQNSTPVVKLPEQEFTDYFMQMKQKSYYDLQIYIGKNKYLINKIKMMVKSQYFFNLFSKVSLGEQISIVNILSDESKIVYQIFINFLENDWLVVPDNVSVDTFLALTILADYFCIPILSQLCCNELLSMISGQNVEKVLEHSLKMRLLNVTKACCDFWIKKASENMKFYDIKEEINRVFMNNKQVCDSLEQMFGRISFDLAQNMMQNQKVVPNLSKKTDSSVSMQKQNYETNVYNH